VAAAERGSPDQNGQDLSSARIFKGQAAPRSVWPAACCCPTSRGGGTTKGVKQEETDQIGWSADGPYAELAAAATVIMKTRPDNVISTRSRTARILRALGSGRVEKEKEGGI
jgi:hypothetical protein